MKKLMAFGLIATIVSSSFAQTTVETPEVTTKNSWLKAGVSTSVPVGDVSNYSSFSLGAELSGQLMATRNFGIGIASGYTHFFPKNEYKDFGVIPAGLLLRYYPQEKGFFAGTDLGYSFITNTTNSNGGFYIKPQLGYHNYNWNLFGFYNQVFRQTGYIDIQNIGIAATYNIRFKK